MRGGGEWKNANEIGIENESDESLLCIENENDDDDDDAPPLTAQHQNRPPPPGIVPTPPGLDSNHRSPLPCHRAGDGICQCIHAEQLAPTHAPVVATGSVHPADVMVLHCNRKAWLRLEERAKRWCECGQWFALCIFQRLPGKCGVYLAEHRCVCVYCGAILEGDIYQQAVTIAHYSIEY